MSKAFTKESDGDDDDDLPEEIVGLPAGAKNYMTPQGFDRLREETQMPAHRAESPLTCVAVGSGRSLEEFEAIHRSNRNRNNNRRPPRR